MAISCDDGLDIATEGAAGLADIVVAEVTPDGDNGGLRLGGLPTLLWEVRQYFCSTMLHAL